jgi:hypothetical protein
MAHCNPCAGPNPMATCPGGTAAAFTDTQLAVAQKLVSTSPKSMLERQCQKYPARFVSKAGISAVDSNPNGILSPTVLGLVAVLVTVAVIILLLHSFIPQLLWEHVDFTSLLHKVPPGSAPIRENTPLGSAFTLAFVFLAPALAIMMSAMNEKVEANALVPLMSENATMTLGISLFLPLWTPLGNDTGYCAEITYVKGSFQGMTCDNAGGSFSLNRACIIVLNRCRLVDPSAQVVFSVPWTERFVSWSVSVDSTDEAKEHKLSGVVTSGDASSLISPKGVVVAMQVQPAFLNDTTNANFNRHGSLLSHLPCEPPVAINMTEGWDLWGPDMKWNLTFEIRASQTLYVTVRSMKQSPWELVTGIFTTVMGVMGVWRAFFSHVEGPVSAFRSMLTRRRRTPLERPPSGVELQSSDRVAFLARVISSSKPDDSAAQDAVKKERKARQEADEELHELLVRLTKQMQEQHEQHERAIRQLAQKFEQVARE